MTKLSAQENQRLISRIKDVSGIIIKPPVEVITDTTEYTRIQRGHVIRLGRREFFVSGDVYESRFGMKEDSKYWVKRGYDLESGRRVIIKFEFHEEFMIEIGSLRIPCFRSPKKEGEVLWLVRGDPRFMQGEMLKDDCGNHVRVLEFIDGNTLYGKIYEMEIDHEQYYRTLLVPILKKVIGCCEAIQMLHNHNLYHGDIRNDHIIIDAETGEYRWIDFDLCQNIDGYDVWRIGNVIQYVVGKGLNSFYEIRNSGRFSADTISGLQASDGGMLYPYRIMNLKKLYPYITERLNRILMRYSAGTKNTYQSVLELTRDLYEAIPDIPANRSEQVL